MGRIVFLDTSDIGAGYAARAARALGHEPLFLCRLDEYHADTRAQIRREPHLEVNTRDMGDVLASLAQFPREEIAAITSFADNRLKLATELARELGVAGLDPAVLALKDKGHVASLARELSPPGVRFSRHHIPAGEIAALLRLGPVVIKPTDGAGALGVFFIRNHEEIAQLGACIRAHHVPEAMQAGGWLAQGCVSGELVSLEGYVLGGEVRLLGFTGRKRVALTESAASFPVDGTLSDEARAGAQHCARTLVARSGFHNGYFHIEFIVDARTGRPWLIDANMGRLGGGPVGELLALSYGIEPVDVFRHVLEVSLFGRESTCPWATSAESRALRESFSVLYGLQAGGELESVEFPQDVACYHTRLLDEGARVTPMGTNDWSWIGIVSGLRRDTLDAVDRIRIRTAQGTEQAYY